MEFTRRSFLALAATAAGAASARIRVRWPESPYGPFRMGIQSYSLRGMKVDQALEATRRLGLEWWEGWEGHIPITDSLADRSEARLKLREAGVKMRTFGVVGFGTDAARNRRVFEFARAMGVETLSADPTIEAFDNLQPLCEEFKIRIAIHNHGPGSRYDSIDSVARVVSRTGPWIGACVDTGHFLRSKEDPVRAIEAFEGRTYGVHLKDVKDATRFMILGKGDLDLVGTLRALKRQGYNGVLSLEYEENPQDPMADLEECLMRVREAIANI